MSPHRSACSIAAATLLLATAAALQAAPQPGHYDAQLCVTLAEQPASCGPVQARLARNGLRLQLSDIVYRLELRGNQLDVTLMHGTMQIDGFSAPFDWSGGDAALRRRRETHALRSAARRAPGRRRSRPGFREAERPLGGRSGATWGRTSQLSCAAASSACV